MGGMGGMMQQGVQQGMQQPAMMQQANGYQGGMANGPPIIITGITSFRD